MSEQVRVKWQSALVPMIVEETKNNPKSVRTPALDIKQDWYPYEWLQIPGCSEMLYAVVNDIKSLTQCEIICMHTVIKSTRHY